jgi:hypothetical protein
MILVEEYRYRTIYEGKFLVFIVYRLSSALFLHWNCYHYLLPDFPF